MFGYLYDMLSDELHHLNSWNANYTSSSKALFKYVFEFLNSNINSFFVRSCILCFEYLDFFSSRVLWHISISQISVLRDHTKFHGHMVQSAMGTGRSIKIRLSEHHCCLRLVAEHYVDSDRQILFNNIHHTSISILS